MLRCLILIAALTAGFAAPAFAQEGEIIVTGSRIARYERYDDFQIPYVFLKRRADFAIVSLSVRSDTRDQGQRLEEIRTALRGLQSRARPGGVTLALVDEEIGIVRDFSLANAEKMVGGDGRPDTSVVEIRLRTPVGADDTLDSIEARIEDFVDHAPKPGRVEMSTGETQLTLVNPGQYRDPLLQQITADGQRAAAMLGEGYALSLAGLERQIAWQRTGELELTLFFPYTLAVQPQP